MNAEMESALDRTWIQPSEWTIRMMETLARMPGMTLTLSEFYLAIIASLPRGHRALELDSNGARRCVNVTERLLLETWQPSSPRRGHYVEFDPDRKRVTLTLRGWKRLMIWLAEDSNE